LSTLASGNGVLEGADGAASSTSPKVTVDYHLALLRLTTMRAASKPIFGYIELFPRDILLPESFHLGG
jgi:hypothetical protein